MKKHANSHPLLKRARAYNALAMRLDMPFEHYRKLAQQCLEEYARLKERNRRLNERAKSRRSTNA